MTKCFTILFLLFGENLFAQGPVTYYTDFEQPLPPDFPLVIHDTAGNLWQIGTPMKAFFDSAYSGKRALVTDTIHPYTPNNHSYFDITIDTGGEYNVSFLHKYQTNKGHAGGYIGISYDGGAHFYNIVNNPYVDSGLYFDLSALYTASDTLLNGMAAFNGSADWQYIDFDFGFVVGSVTKRSWFDHFPILRFNFISDSSESFGDGWMIDNLQVIESFPSGIQNVGYHNDALTVFPNPALQNTTVTFQPKQKEFADISLYDLSGKKILSLAHENFLPGNQQIDLPMKNLAEGIYFLKYETADVVQSVKIVKQ